MESHIRKRYQLTAVLVLLSSITWIGQAKAQATNPAGCGSLWAQDTAAHIWTDQGTASAYVQSEAKCQPDPIPASKSAPTPCVLWSAGAAIQQFGTEPIEGLVGSLAINAQQVVPATPGTPTIPMVQMCGGTPTGIVWVPDPCQQHPCPSAVVPPAVLKQLLDRIPMPTVTLAMSPSQSVGGICGLPTQFWATGYDGSPISWSGGTAAGGHVDLIATPRAFSWDFGDGARVDSTGPGSPWPQTTGAVTHIYEVKSADAGFATGPLASNPGTGGYPIGLSVKFDVRYRLDGGAWQGGLTPIDRSVSSHYPVYEVRSRLVG